jgi:hypothetical protein
MLCYDELKALFDKCRLDGSSLLAMIASFFENIRWSNPTKDPKQSIQVNDGHLSMLACCTLDTYSGMWTSEAISIGLANRLFIVSSDRKRKVAWPKEPDYDRIERIVRRIQSQLDTLPKILGITPEAKKQWEDWYEALGSGVHSKRLDAIGFRIMQLLALTNDRQVIDLQTIDATIEILNYEHKIRLLTDPIDSENLIAKMEQKIMRLLQAKGPHEHRKLLQGVNANRAGLWTFETAINNLKHHDQIRFDKTTNIYAAVPENCDEP